MHAFQWKFQFQGLSESMCCSIESSIVVLRSLSLSDLQNLWYAPPFPLNIKDQLLLIYQWCEFFLLACMWNSQCCLVKFWHADFSAGAHWKAHPKMETEIFIFFYFERIRRTRHLHTNFQLYCSEGKDDAGCIHPETHCMNNSIDILKSVSMVDSNSWFRPSSEVFLYHILFQEYWKA